MEVPTPEPAVAALFDEAEIARRVEELARAIT